jgi:hypothetical protein
LGKALVAIDFAFARNMINGLADDANDDDLIDLKRKKLQKSVKDFFELEADTLYLRQLKDLCAASAFGSLPVDFEAIGLQNECRAYWADMQFVRSVLPQSVVTFALPQIPNFGAIMDRLQPLYIQASAAAHSACVDAEVWQKEGFKLEEVRMQIQKVQEPWGTLTKLQIDALGSVHHMFSVVADSKEKYMSAYQDLASILDAGHTSLVNLRIESRNDTTIDANKLWRFDAFCQSLDHIIAELGSLAMLSMRVLSIVDSKNGSECSVFRTFAKLASIDSKDFEECPDLLRRTSLTNIMKQMRGQAPQEDADGGD